MDGGLRPGHGSEAQPAIPRQGGDRHRGVDAFDVLGGRDAARGPWQHAHGIHADVGVSDARGLVVSLIEHDHAIIDIDRPGKDSCRLREAGCMEVLRLGHDRRALMHELRGAETPPLQVLPRHMRPCDLVPIEGFGNGDFPKREVWRAEPGKPTPWPASPGIVAIAGDGAAGLASAGARPRRRHRDDSQPLLYSRP